MRYTICIFTGNSYTHNHTPHPPSHIHTCTHTHTHTHTQMSLQSQFGTAAATAFSDDLTHWHKQLQTVEAVLRAWLEVQQLWVGLEEVYGSPEVQAHLPGPTFTFSSVDQELRELTMRTTRNPAVMPTCLKEGNTERGREGRREGGPSWHTAINRAKVYAAVIPCSYPLFHASCPRSMLLVPTPCFLSPIPSSLSSQDYCHLWRRCKQVCYSASQHCCSTWRARGSTGRGSTCFPQRTSYSSFAVVGGAVGGAVGGEQPFSPR